MYSYSDLTPDDRRELESWLDGVSISLDASLPEPARCGCGELVPDDPRTICPACGAAWAIANNCGETLPSGDQAAA